MLESVGFCGGCFPRAACGFVWLSGFLFVLLLLVGVVGAYVACGFGDPYVSLAVLFCVGQS